MDIVTIHDADELFELAKGESDGLNWTLDPVFAFETEVDALQVLQLLADDLNAARKQLHHVMRYMEAAVKAAGATVEDGERVRPQAIINHTRLSRRTVYKWLGQAGITDKTDAPES
ncbi:MULTISPECIES: hypothetical protein [unclassified Nonomuraea]|uniref:hypothetical protein n=1 Tax=unclassified Nonomuraea TaxID=2593643 RepID=UPI0033E76E1C